MFVQNIYGYERTADGGLKIIPEEAEVVKRIFSMYLDGLGVLKIAKILTEECAPSNSNGKWSEKKVRYILSNEKYAGDLLLQKSFCTDHLTKHRKKNCGEKPKYYVRDNHEPVISRQIFDAVQLEIERRKKRYCKTSEAKTYEFTGKIECGICGKNYRRKVTATGVVWICSTFNKMGKKECASKQIPDEILHRVTAEVLGTEKFNADIFDKHIDKIIARQTNRLVFLFKDGHTVEQRWKDRSRSESWSDEMKENARQKALERKRNNDENSNGYTCNN